MRLGQDAEFRYWHKRRVCKQVEETAQERLALLRANRETRELGVNTAQGRYIERTVAEFTIINFARSYHRLVGEKIEIHPPSARRDKLIELGVAPEIVAQFFEWDKAQAQATFDAISNECQRIGKETPKTLEQNTNENEN